MYSMVIIADNTASCRWMVVFSLYIQKGQVVFSLYIQKDIYIAKDIPGGSVVETLRFQCRGCRFSCWLKN